MDEKKNNNELKPKQDKGGKEKYKKYIIFATTVLILLLTLFLLLFFTQRCKRDGGNSTSNEQSNSLVVNESVDFYTHLLSVSDRYLEDAFSISSSDKKVNAVGFENKVLIYVFLNESEFDLFKITTEFNSLENLISSYNSSNEMDLFNNAIEVERYNIVSHDGTLKGTSKNDPSVELNSKTYVEGNAYFSEIKHFSGDSNPDIVFSISESTSDSLTYQLLEFIVRL